MEKICNLLLGQAQGLIEKAKNELHNHPDKDYVAFIICHNASNAIRWLLCAWLENNHFRYNKTSSLPDLIKLCKKHSAVIHEMDFNRFSCFDSARNCTNEVCLNNRKISACLAMAEKLHTFILEEEREKISDHNKLKYYGNYSC